MSEAANKRRKTSGDGGRSPFDLLALYEGDLGKKILSYASGSDLCILDAVSKRFQRLTTAPWGDVAEARFGIRNGKKGWKVGASFLRQPTFMHLTDKGDHGYGDAYAGTARVASNGSIVVAVADDVEENNTRRDYPHEENAMDIRDAWSLNYMRTAPSPSPNWRVAICGRVGSEIIVTSNGIEICAIRGHKLQGFRCTNWAGNGIPIVGSETHLIMSNGRALQTFRVNPNSAEAEDPEDNGRILLPRKLFVPDDIESEDFILNMSWGPDKSHVVVCYREQINVLAFDAASDAVSLAQTIDTEELDIENAALANEYIVGASKHKKLFIWSRRTGEVLHQDLCDVEEDDEVVEDDIVHDTHLSCHGNVLVTTSHIGCALCVWDMKTGKLLKRYNDAEDENFVDMLPDGFDATDMVYLERLNAFMVMSGGFMNVWAFPYTKRQRYMSKSIRRREQHLEKSDDYDDDYAI